MGRSSGRRALEKLNAEVRELEAERTRSERSRRAVRRAVSQLLVLVLLGGAAYLAYERLAARIPNPAALIPTVRSVRFDGASPLPDGGMILYLEAVLSGAEAVRASGIGICPGCEATVTFSDGSAASFPLSVERFDRAGVARLSLLIPRASGGRGSDRVPWSLVVRSADGGRTGPVELKVGERSRP